MMTGLLLMIALAGLILVGMLLARLRAVDQTLQLKRHRSGEAGVCDLLNYAAVVGKTSDRSICRGALRKPAPILQLQKLALV
jgi:hypothetical protein